jgi:hypothetical protein
MQVDHLMSNVGIYVWESLARVAPTLIVRFLTMPAFATSPTGRRSDIMAATGTKGAGAANYAVTSPSAGATPRAANITAKLLGSTCPARRRQACSRPILTPALPDTERKLAG